ncbi:phosphotransferase [Microlunatus elymi]|uniref:Phosphotransferase n=1 Tax=Microlunatus elymi TaxID=2596828 RepID=A0A516PXQ6_9ACTN|nr:phosphotransferase [Microlunatus elymi]QDP95958.1 phosphotransferase [Microlunatus elymi]
MRTAPQDLTDAAVAETVAAHWGITAAAIEPAPVGFGSHHWELTGTDGSRWFATADRVGDSGHALTTLAAALHTAYALEHRCGLAFVVAPTPGADHRLLAKAGDYAVALYPFLERVGAGVADPEQLLTMIIAVHKISPALVGVVQEDDLEIEQRRTLEAVLSKQRRGSGPFAEDFAELVIQHRQPIEKALQGCDRMAAEQRGDKGSWVITHGEAKINNTMITADGPVLIDWDTVRVGPPARDVWMLPSAQEYAARTGRSVPQQHLDHYRLVWDLKDLCSYAGWFAGDHERTADTELGWQGCQLICQRLADEFG